MNTLQCTNVSQGYHKLTSSAAVSDGIIGGSSREDEEANSQSENDSHDDPSIEGHNHEHENEAWN